MEVSAGECIDEHQWNTLIIMHMRFVNASYMIDKFWLIYYVIFIRKAEQI